MSIYTCQKISPLCESLLQDKMDIKSVKKRSFLVRVSILYSIDGQRFSQYIKATEVE